MSVVLDASAVLAFLKSEPGAEIVQQQLRRACLSAVNFLEVLEKSRNPENRIAQVVRLLRGYQVEFVPFDEETAYMASVIKMQVGNADVSLADRCCLALAARRDLPVLTSDRVWKTLPIDVEVILIRGEMN